MEWYEALILGTDDSVNEGSGENIFLVKDNQLITPELLTVNFKLLFINSLVNLTFFKFGKNLLLVLLLA